MKQGHCLICGEFEPLNKQHVFHKDQGGWKSQRKWIGEQSCHPELEKTTKQHSEMCLKRLQQTPLPITSGTATSGTVIVGQASFNYTGDLIIPTNSSTVVLKAYTHTIDIGIWAISQTGSWRMTPSEVTVIDPYTAVVSSSSSFSAVLFAKLELPN